MLKCLSEEDASPWKISSIWWTTILRYPIYDSWLEFFSFKYVFESESSETLLDKNEEEIGSKTFSKRHEIMVIAQKSYMFLFEIQRYIIYQQSPCRIHTFTSVERSCESTLVDVSEYLKKYFLRLDLLSCLCHWFGKRSLTLIKERTNGNVENVYECERQVSLCSSAAF